MLMKRISQNAQFKAMLIVTTQKDNILSSTINTISVISLQPTFQLNKNYQQLPPCIWLELPRRILKQYLPNKATPKGHPRKQHTINPQNFYLRGIKKKIITKEETFQKMYKIVCLSSHCQLKPTTTMTPLVNLTTFNVGNKCIFIAC